VQRIIASPIAEVGPEASAYLEVASRRYGQISLVEQSMTVRAQQDAVTWIVRTIVGLGSDVRGVEGRK
jgi:hypothetical protein